LLLLALHLFAPAPFAYGQTGPQPGNRAGGASISDPRLDKLPPALRERGAALLNQKNENERARIAADLARAEQSAAMEFLLSVFETEPSATVRYAIVNRLGRYSHPQVRQMLERCALSDKDDRVAILALERLRAQRAEDLFQLLEQRLEQAHKNGDEKQIRLLGKEQERWISLVKGTMLPTFMQIPPPLFSLKAADRPIRVLAFGDFGTGSAQQKQVAAAMLQYHRKEPFDFAITLGDNFYNDGMESPNDPRWETWWDELYNPLGIKVYATLGNHDWGYSNSPAAEILYSQKSPSWRMPAAYYTFTAGPVQFFALDTNEMSEAQLLWLRDELDSSRATWKVVYGHHPIYSAGAHEDNPKMIKRLLPVLKGRADVFIAGHDHDLQHLKPEGGVHFFVSGGGGASLRQPRPGPRSLFAKGVHGFAVMEADARQLKVTFVDVNLNKLYEYILNKQDRSTTTGQSGSASHTACSGCANRK